MTGSLGQPNVASNFGLESNCLEPKPIGTPLVGKEFLDFADDFFDLPPFNEAKSGATIRGCDTWLQRQLRNGS